MFSETGTRYFNYSKIKRYFMHRGFENKLSSSEGNEGLETGSPCVAKII